MIAVESHPEPEISATAAVAGRPIATRAIKLAEPSVVVPFRKGRRP
jgi:hypothetical protein